MGRRKRKSDSAYNHTPTTLLVALSGGACAFITVESTAGDALEAWGHRRNRLPAWQIHMGSLCAWAVAFFVFLFLLEFLETGSRSTAWRSSAPWLPLSGIAALATAVHIPVVLVLIVGSGYSVWAYRRTCSARRLTGPYRGKETE